MLVVKQVPQTSAQHSAQPLVLRQVNRKPPGIVNGGGMAPAF